MAETVKKTRAPRKGKNIDEEFCKLWSKQHPAGTLVDVRRADQSITRTKARSEAFVCESGFRVIFLEGIKGYYSLELVQVVT